MTKHTKTEIAALGGKAVPASKRVYSINRELARLAGSKGGKSVAPEKRSFSRDRKLASEVGRAGGIASGKVRAAKRAAKRLAP